MVAHAKPAEHHNAEHGSSQSQRADLIAADGVKSDATKTSVQSEPPPVFSRLLSSPGFEHVMAIAIVLNFVVVIVETDQGAKDDDIPTWAYVMSWTLLVIFVFELVLKLSILRGSFWNSRWNIFDFLVISIDFIMSVIGIFVDGSVSISALRIVRLARLARATQMMRVFPELRLMLAGLVGAMSAILWGTVFLVSVLLIWAVIAVQFIHPLNEEVAKHTSKYIHCDRCPHAYESTFQAALTFSTQIVAGDSWGRETVPIIEMYPESALFFGAVYVSVGLALLNLILGVVVNVATEERERQIEQLKEEKKAQRKEAHDGLYQMCKDMDEDGNEELTFDEIKHGYDNNRIFRDMLETMEIGRDDLDIVWTILDSDKSGTVTAKEFATQIYHMKSSETQFLIAYIRFYLVSLQGALKEGQATLKAELKHGQVDLHQNLSGGQKDLRKELGQGQVELQKKLRGGQEELQRKLRAGQEELSKRLRCGQQRLLRDLRAGQERLRFDMYRVQGKEAKYEPHVEEIIEEEDFKEMAKDTGLRPRAISSEDNDAIDDKDPRSQTIDSIASLQIFVDKVQIQTLKSEGSSVDTATSDQYVERLAELHNVWQQCIVSIDALHDRQGDLATLLAFQAKSLVSVIQCTPLLTTQPTQLAI